MARLEIAAFVAFLPPCLPGGELNVPLLDVGQLLLEGEHLKTGGGVGAGRGGRRGPAHPQEGEVRRAVAAGAKVIRQTLSRLKINERSVMTGSFSGFDALLASTACASMMSVLVLDASSLCALASTPPWSSVLSFPCSGSRSPSSSSGSSSSTIFSPSLNSNWRDSSAITEWSSTSRSSYLSMQTNWLDMNAPKYSKVFLSSYLLERRSSWSSLSLASLSFSICIRFIPSSKKFRARPISFSCAVSSSISSRNEARPTWLTWTAAAA